jgi:transforming growth factor-beta-induced protein
MKIARFALTAMAIVGLSFSANTASAQSDKDIVDTAVEAGVFNTLAAALTAADLVDVLKSEGPFTVFAPTDEAFAKLPEGTVESLLLPENKDQLTAILLYHVVAGSVTSDQVVTLNSAVTVNGASVTIMASDAGVMVDNANVTAVDILASNGVIHVIDAVILPPAGPTAVESNSWGAVKSEATR